jgi:prevent-host-death family protein
MDQLSIEEARRQLGELVDRARLAGEPTLIMRYRKPAAVIVGADWYDRASALMAQPEGGAG